MAANSYTQENKKCVNALCTGDVQNYVNLWVIDFFLRTVPVKMIAHPVVRPFCRVLINLHDCI